MPSSMPIQHAPTKAKCTRASHLLSSSSLLWQVGWVEGVIEERNTNPRFKLDGDFVNFWVYYQLDNNCSKHVLETDMYAWGPEAEADSWVLLTEVPAAEMVSGVAAVAAVVGEPAPMVAPID